MRKFHDTVESAVQEFLETNKDDGENAEKVMESFTNELSLQASILALIEGND